MASGSEADFDWIFDYLASTLSSPSFTGPLEAFVEGEQVPRTFEGSPLARSRFCAEKCIVFDNDEENKLVYTTIHEVRGSAGPDCSLTN